MGSILDLAAVFAVRPALGLTRLPTGYWGVLAGLLIAYLGVGQLVKAWLVRRFGLS